MPPAAMTVSYTSLLERVGHFLFGIRSSFSADQTTDIGDAIKDGLHDVYTAHTWSFFRPNKPIVTTAPYATGTITIVAGVVTLAGGTFPSWAALGMLKVDDDYYEVSTRDSNTQVTLVDTSVAAAAGSTYELLRLEYDLPTGFESIETRLSYPPGRSEYYPDAEMRDDHFIRDRQRSTTCKGRPGYFSIRTVEFDPTVGSRRRISFYPLADAAYSLTGRMILRPTMIDATNLYPIGGEMLGQLILEACLAAADRLYNEVSDGVPAKRFQALLPQAITADLLATSPTHLGPDDPDGERSEYERQSKLIGEISINGVVL